MRCARARIRLQVSSPISSPHMSEAHAFAPSGSVYATNHMHHYGAHPTINNYQQLLNSLAQRLGSDGADGSVGGAAANMFGPMHDAAAAAAVSPPSVVIIAPSTDAPTTNVAVVIARTTQAPAATNVFHIVKPDFALRTSKKSEKTKRVKDAASRALVTTTQVATTTINADGTLSTNSTTSPSPPTTTTTTTTMAKLRPRTSPRSASIANAALSTTTAASTTKNSSSSTQQMSTTRSPKF